MITDEEKKPKVLSTEELLKRFNAEKAGTPGAVNEELDPWGHRLVDPDSLLAGKASRPRVPEAQPVARDTTKPTAEFDGMLDWNTLEKAKKEYEREPRLSAKEYIQGLGNKVKSSVMGLGEMVLETPQGIESLSNAPAVMLTEAMIKRKLRRGEIDQETGDYLMTEAKSMTPRRTVTGNMLFTDTMPEEMLADGDLNTWFEKNKVRFSEMGDKYDKTASQYLKSGQFGKALGAVSYGIAESLAPTIAAAVIPGGAVALGVGVGSTAYDDVKDREDMTEAMKMADAVTVGIFEWLFERFGTREMTKQLFDIYKKTGKTGIVNAVNSNAVQQLFAKAYKKFGVWFAPVHEGISEGLTTLGQNLAAIFSGEDPERQIGDGFWDSVLIGAGMGGMFSLTEKTAEQYRIAREGKAGPITGPLTIEDQDPEQMIRDLGKKYAYNGFNNEIPEQNFIKYGEMKDGRKVIIKSTNFATDPANMLVTIVDAENPESKPEMTKGNMIINSMDVPYEEWVANEMRNYQATMQQVSNEAAKATAPVQEGATIPIGEQLFNVTQVTDQGIVLNEIDKEGNLTANSQTITPDKYGEVFGMPADQAPQTQERNPLAQAAQVAQPTTVSPQSRKVSDGKNEFTIIPQEDGNFRMSESFETQKEAETALKKLQERYPKLTWKAEMTDSEDLFTPDTYTIVAEPKKKPAAPAAKKEELTSASLSVKDETGIPSSESIDTTQGSSAMESNNVSSVQSEAIQTRTTEDEVSKSTEITSESSTDSFEDIIPVTGKPNKGVIETGYNYMDGVTAIQKVLDEVGIADRFQNAELRNSSYLETEVNGTQVLIRIADHTKRLGPKDDASYVSRRPGWFEADIVTPEGIDVLSKRLREVFRTPSTPDVTAAEEEVQNAGEVETQPTKGIPTYSQKKQIVLDHFGGMYEDAAASTPEQIYEQVPEVTPEEARQIHAEIKGEFEAEQEKTRNAPDPFVSIAKAEGQVDLRPTEEQKKAGNYKKGHVNLLGFDISIENPAGSVRSGVSKDGTKWSNLMNNTYGYFRRTEGKDGDQVDVFIGDNLDSDAVYVVDQVDPETGVFDEHKVMLGFNSAESARENYLANYEPGWKGLGAISKMSLEGFKEWLGDAKRTRKPVDPNVPVKEKEEQKPSEDTRPVKKVKKKKGWPMSKAEARLSREPQSFEEAVYQFFLGGGRISMADYYRHFGRNNSERLKNIWMYSSKPNAIKLDLLNEVSIFQYHPELLIGIGDGAMDQANAFVDVIRGMGGKSDIRRELDRIQSRTAEALEGEDLTPEEKEITEFTDDVENLTDETLLDPDLLVIFELELNELGKSFADIKETVEKEPEYFYVFPYGLSDKQFNELKDILNDTDRQRQVKELVEKGRGNEITGQGDQAERGGETDESGTSGEETEEGGADEGRDESTEVTPEFAGDIFNAPEKKELPKLKSPEKISDFHKWLTPRWKDNFGTDFDAAKIPTFNQAKQRFYNESAIEYEGDKNAQKYINGIKNAEKKKYAKAYNEWILNGRPKDQEPERGELSYMGAQSVWMQLNKFYTPTEGHGLIDEGQSAEASPREQVISTLQKRLTKHFQLWSSENEDDDFEYFLESEIGLTIDDDGIIDVNVAIDDEIDGLLKGQTIYAYHGTSTAILPNIAQNGLIANPNTDVNRRGAPMQGVYLSTTPSGPAMDGYTYNAVQSFGGEPVVLKVKVKYDKLIPDVNDSDIRAGYYQRVINKVEPKDIEFPETTTQVPSRPEFAGEIFDKPKEQPKQEQRGRTIWEDKFFSKLESAYSVAVSEWERNKVLDDISYSLAGPQNVYSRQDLLEYLTGKRPPKANAGVSALKAELKKWIEQRQETEQPAEQTVDKSTEAPEETPVSGEYKYKMIARPFDKGAFPEDGFIRSENDPNGGFQILTYDRQMPVKEWNKWDLVPLTDIEDIKDKEFIDKDGDYSKITLKWWGNNRGADVSMYDADGNLVEEPFGTSVKDIFTNIEEGYWIEKPAQEAAPGKTPVKEIWQMTKQDFAYSPLRYDGMPTTDGSGVFRAEENPDGTWNAWVESPDGKKDYWSRNASAGEAWDGGRRKTAYMNQEADAKSMDRHKEAVTQALNEGKPVPEEVLRNYIGLKDYLEKQKKKEAAKPKEKESPIPANYREQIDNLKAIALKESTGLDTNRRIAEINALETPTKAQIKERNQLRVILENTREDIAKRNDKVDYNIIPENKVREIRKLIDETRALDEAIGQRILRLQDERDAKEKSLQKRAGLFGDRKEEEERKSGMQPMFAGEIFEASSDNLQAALKPFNDAIKKAEDERKRNAQLLDEKIALVLSGAQMEIDMEPPAEPATTKPIDKESLPKHEDFGEKIGGARKDMGITRTVRDTDALPAWRRKYFYADPSGVMNLGDPTIDTSKPFLVKWSKEVKSWSGTRTMGYPVTTIDTRETKIFNSEAEAEAYIPIYEVWKQGFRIRKKDGNYVITKTSSTGKVVEYATFPTEEEATTYLYSTEGATSLLNHKREDFSIPALDKVERTGKDWRQGRDVSTEEFMDAFGFRGGEFGNWVKPEERRVMLNAAYDSFMDLAEMLKVPPRAMSLSGELSIAFGARGTKGYAAHFEPGRAVINMTRMNGAGSLAHEWAHALDNYFGLQAAKKDYTRNEKGEVAAGYVMRTKADLLSKRGMRKELSELFDAIVNATQEKSVTRVMRIEEKQKAYDGQIKRLKDEAEALIRKFENGVRRYKYNRKAKKHEEVIVKATPEQIKKAQAIIDNIVEGKGTRPKWAIIPGSKGHMEYSYISPETMALEAVYKEVFGKSGLKRDGNGFYNLGYFADKAYAAREILDKALAGESETLSVPTEFLKVSKKFDRSRSNPYWSTKVEMFARAFEYFIETKLEDQKARSDYLQYDKAPVYDAVYGMNPYPAGEERTALNELFQKFFDEVKTKEEGGRTTMFRTGNIKKHQLDIIKATNPMLDDYHTGIRSITDIKTAQEAFNELIETGEEAAPDFTAADMQRALQTGRITVYSSYPIKNGVFVTPSRMQAKSYAGDGTVYSEIVDISDVAWIDYIEGQYAKISGESNAFRTSNRGTFDPKNDNILFRVIGERGAGAIEGLLDNLSVARKMEEAGRSAKEVFLATGWQRGVDNLWRYETRDIELKKGVDFISKLKPQNEAFTEEVPLTDIIEDEELFNSYPELKDVKLTFYNYGSHPELERTGGFANPSEKTIGIGTENLAATNKGRSLFPGRFVSDGTRGVFRPGLEYRHLYVYDRDSFRSVLSHEIQHHIQRVEGFAEGATAVGAKRAGSPTILYEAAAGEVEARNVQRRLELTPDERRERMLIETEDVERGQQEIIRKEYDIQENRAIVPKTPQPTGLDALNRILGLDEEDDQRYEVKKQVEDLSKQLRTPVKVIGNRGELPANVQEEAKKQGVWENETLYGAWDPKTGTMFILLDDLMKLGPQRAAKEGVKTVLHEAVAHKGLPILLGDKGYADLVEEIYDSIPDDDLTLIRYQYDWTEDRELIAKEYLAMMAEDNVNPSLFKRIVAKIREWLRKYFNLSYTENDVYSLLRASRKNLEDTPEEERGFYRSRPKADNFDFAGEYVQAQGTYFRSRKAAVSKRNTTLGKAAEAYMEKAAVRTGKETLEGIREYIQDLSLPIRRFEEELLRRGGKQDNTSKPYRDMSLSFGRQEKLYNDYFEGKMKPILQAVADIKRAGMRGEDILPYIIAKHAIERNQAFRSRELKEWVEGHKENVPQDEVNAKMEELKDKDYSGVMGFDTEGKYTNPDELARDIVSEFEGQVDPKFIDNLWKKVSAATSEILDTWERGNQISPDQKQEYLSQFRYFVPLRGWREGAAKELVYTKGDGFSRSLQYAKGRKSLADNPLAYLLNVQFQAIAEQVDNEVKTSMVNLIIKNLSNNEMHEMATIKKLYYVKITLPDGTVEWEPTTIRPSQEMFDNGDARTKIYSEHERLRKPHQAREHEVYVRKPGGDMVMVFNGKHLSTAQAMNKQNYMYRTIFGNIYDARDLNKVMALMGHMNNMLKALYTSWNIVFPFTNFMRDFQEASITQQIKSKSGGKVIKNYRAAFPAIIRRIQGKQDLKNPMDQQLEDFYNLGGATGYTHMKSPEEIEKDINKEVARMVRKGTIAGGIGDAGHALLGAVERWNKIFEDATRFSVYLSSLAIGNTKEDAAIDAKEASVNFNRKGKGSKAWDSWFAFWNVALQSMQKNFKLAKDHTGRFSAIASSFVMLGFLEAMMNALTDDDDDPDSSYYNLNSYMRQNYLVIPLPQIGDLRKKGNKYLSIPLPQFWRGFKSMGSIGFDVATGRMKAGEAVTTALGNFAGGLLPVDIGGFYKSGEFSVAPLVPTITKPVVELIENRNYMGYTIKKEPFTKEQKKYLANAGLGKDNVNPAAKFFTDMLFRWSGGDSRYKYYTDKQGRTRKVILDVNPSTIEYLFKGYTGGTGGVVSDLITTVSQTLDPDEEVDFKNVPFVNKFLRQTPPAKWNIISEYYDLKEANDRDITLMKEYEKQGRETGNTSQYERMAEDEYRIERKMIFDSYEDQISDLTKGVTKDDTETSSLVIELMDMCVGEVKELEARYKRKY